MIENEKQSEAVKAVTALARFFRISLSKGKSIIPVRDELEHVRNYLMIQHMRYKNKFSYSIEAEDEVLGLASLKLIYSLWWKMLFIMEWNLWMVTARSKYGHGKRTTICI